jgi:hypothetical protein
MLGNGAKLIKLKLGGSQKHTGSMLKFNCIDIGSNFGGWQKHIGSMLTSSIMLNLTDSMLGNGAKLITSNFGGSQKQIGSMLSPTATSNDILSKLGNGAKPITSKLGGLQKHIGSKLIGAKLGGSQKHTGSILKSITTSKDTMLGIQQPTKDITLGKWHPSSDITLILHGLTICITCGVLHASITDIQQDICDIDICEGHKFTSGNKIGGKFNSGPGHICFGAINCGNAGISGI